MELPGGGFDVCVIRQHEGRWVALGGWFRGEEEVQRCARWLWCSLPCCLHGELVASGFDVLGPCDDSAGLIDGSCCGVHLVFVRVIA